MLIASKPGNKTISAAIGTLVVLVLGLIPPNVLSNWTSNLQATLRNDAPNAADYARIEHNYYERILENRPPARPDSFNPGMLCDRVDDVREYVLKPSITTLHKGATWTANTRGMRDGDYPEAKTPGKLRIGLVGDSIAAGWGVNDGEGFEPKLESLWNVEFLNFAVPGHAPGQRWEHFSRIGWAMHPDVVMVESTLADLGWDARRLRVLLPRGVGFDASVFRDALKVASIVPSMVDPKTIKDRLDPIKVELLAGVYRRIVADCHARGVPVVWLLLPRVGKPITPGDHALLLRLAQAAGFDQIVDLTDTFAGRRASDLAIAPDDFHPNVLGHEQLARRIDAAVGDFVSRLSDQSRQEKWEGPSPSASQGHAPAALRPESTNGSVDRR